MFAALFPRIFGFETGFGPDGDVAGIVQVYFGILTGHQSSRVGFIIEGNVLPLRVVRLLVLLPLPPPAAMLP